MSAKQYWALLLALATVQSGLLGQVRQGTQQQQQLPPQSPQVIRPQMSTAPPAQTPQNSSTPQEIPGQTGGAMDTDKLRLNYTLGVNDQILVRAPDVEELNEKAFRIEAEGTIKLPMVGVVRAAGSTIQQLEAELVKQLSVYFRNPRVTISVSQYRSDPAFFVGSFRSPGIYPLQGSRTLVEMLTVVGGLASNASRRLRITRRLDMGKIPLPSATTDVDRKESVVEISITKLLETVNPEEDIVLQPYDVVRASPEEAVYISGAVTRVGAIPLVEKDSISLLQALSLSGGLNSAADGSKAKVLRPILDTTRRAEIPVNIDAIMNGKETDFPLLPNDVLLVPQSKSVTGAARRYVVILLPALATSLVTSLIFISLRK